MSNTTLRKVRVYRHDFKAPRPGGVIPRKIAPPGWFHEWGINYEELGDNVGPYTVAIVERLDGSCVTVAPDLIEFIEPPVSE